MIEEIKNPRTHLYVHDLRTRGLAPIVTDRLVLSGSWAWSGDGSCIYFAERDWTPVAAKRVWKVDLATKAQELLVDFAGLDRFVDLVSPCPDGRALLVVTTEFEDEAKSKLGEERELSLLDLTNKRWWTVARGKLWRPAWSPRGDVFAIAVDGNLWVIERETLKAKRVFP